MRILLQRVSRASVSIEGEVVGAIGRGVLALVAFRVGDDVTTLRNLAEKLVNLRIFDDESGKMNRSIAELGLSCLAVSQFTLYGDSRKGNRPSFTEAERPEKAKELYNSFVHELRLRLGANRIAEGKFGAMMEVELVNDGPVTLLLDKCPM